CTFPDGLTGELNDMLKCTEQRFYLPHGSMMKLHEINFSANYPSQDMDMNEEVKRLIVREDLASLQDWVNEWGSFITAHQTRPDIVKKWVLNLLLDVEKMIQSLQGDEPDSNDSIAHRSIAEA